MSLSVSDHSIKLDIARSEDDLLQILHLQKLNLKSEISDETKKDQGFLTVRHSMDELMLMYQSTPQIIAKKDGKVIAYALAMLPDLGKLIADLEPMFTILENLQWNSQNLSHLKYYVMGQICVDAGSRGLGVFDQLYHKHKEVYGPDYELCVTEISTSNFRSQRAHERVGFKTIHTHLDHVDEWNVVAWNFSV